MFNHLNVYRCSDVKPVVDVHQTSKSLPGMPPGSTCKITHCLFFPFSINKAIGLTHIIESACCISNRPRLNALYCRMGTYPINDCSQFILLFDRDPLYFCQHFGVLLRSSHSFFDYTTCMLLWCCTRSWLFQAPTGQTATVTTNKHSGLLCDHTTISPANKGRQMEPSVSEKDAPVCIQITVTTVFLSPSSRRNKWYIDFQLLSRKEILF